MQRCKIGRPWAALLALSSLVLAGPTATAQTTASASGTSNPLPHSISPRFFEPQVLRTTRSVQYTPRDGGVSSAGVKPSLGGIEFNLRTGKRRLLPPPSAPRPGKNPTYSSGGLGRAGYLDLLLGLGTESLNLNKVFGPDERERVASPNNWPYNQVCKLYIVFDDGSEGIGSGVLISPRHVLTAGHCIIAPDPITGNIVTATSIRVVPGQDSDNPDTVPTPVWPDPSVPGSPIEHFGSAYSTIMRVTAGWGSSFDRWEDWGMLTLDAPLGDQAGWMGIQTSYTDGKFLFISGYPSDYNNGLAQFFHSGTTSNKTWAFAPRSNLELFHKIDTFKGQSGAPVFDPESYMSAYVYAIHGGWHTFSPGGEQNRAARINTQRLGVIRGWAAEDGIDL